MDSVDVRVRGIIGCPGTMKAVCLRLIQIWTSFIILFNMIRDNHERLFDFSCFKLFVVAISFQGVCSFVIFLQDLYALKRRINLVCPARVGCYIYIDLVSLYIVSAGAASSVVVGSLFADQSNDCMPFGFGQRPGQRYPSCPVYMLPVVVSYLGLIAPVMLLIGNVQILKLIWIPELESPVLSRKELIVHVAAPVILLCLLFWVCFSFVPHIYVTQECKDCVMIPSPTASPPY